MPTAETEMEKRPKIPKTLVKTLKVFGAGLLGAYILKETGAYPFPFLPSLSGLSFPNLPIDGQRIEETLNQVGIFISTLPLPLQRIMAVSALTTAFGAGERYFRDKNWHDLSAIKRDATSGMFLGSALTSWWDLNFAPNIQSIVQPILILTSVLAAAVTESHVKDFAQNIFSRRPSFPIHFPHSFGRSNQ